MSKTSSRRRIRVFNRAVFPGPECEINNLKANFQNSAKWSIPDCAELRGSAESAFTRANECSKPQLLSYKKWLIAKRFTDLLISSACLMMLAPVILIIAILVRADSAGNPFFLQARVGRNSKRFTILKIRTLYINHFGIIPNQEAPDAYRITRIGKYLRRSKLDELPQLINILMGHMSFVGPRPDIPDQVAGYTNFQQKRLRVKPGLTGVSQVSGNTHLCWPDRIYLDIWYIKNWSWLLDLRIILLTFIVIIKGEKTRCDPFGLYVHLSGKT